jgi:hypothetical protein
VDVQLVRAEPVRAAAPDSHDLRADNVSVKGVRAGQSETATTQ